MTTRSQPIQGEQRTAQYALEPTQTSCDLDGWDVGVGSFHSCNSTHRKLIDLPLHVGWARSNKISPNTISDLGRGQNCDRETCQPEPRHRSQYREARL